MISRSKLSYYLAVLLFGKRLASEPEPEMSRDGHIAIQVAIAAEQHDQQARWARVARAKLEKESISHLAGLAKRLRVYHRAANSLAGCPEPAPGQIRAALIAAILGVDNYVAALADDADDDYVFPGEFPIPRF